MSRAAWLVKMVTLALLQIRYPAAPFPGEEARAAAGRDPSYAIYQRYRYAYDTYGYLFLSEQTGEEDGTVGSDGAEGSGGTGGSGGAEDPGGPLGGADPEGPGSPAAGRALSGTALSMSRLQDYDFLMRHFYSVHASTTAGRDIMKAEEFLAADLSLEKDPSVPQILIYHTHSQETYADYGPEHPDATVVGNGAYLAELLRAKGWNVIHDTSTYDIQGGKLDRNRAYTYALEGITRILQANPTVQVVLDLHRDGVGEKVRLVSDVGGKPTAMVMFFQGMSRTPEGTIEYLPNPYLKENLAFAFQMQLAAEGSYPGLTRKIYLKGLRYNLHMRPRSSLIEVGAQTNTSQEARNAMEPLAELLDRVLQPD